MAPWRGPLLQRPGVRDPPQVPHSPAVLCSPSEEAQRASSGFWGPFSGGWPFGKSGRWAKEGTPASWPKPSRLPRGPFCRREPHDFQTCQIATGQTACWRPLQALHLSSDPVSTPQQLWGFCQPGGRTTSQGEVLACSDFTEGEGSGASPTL